MHTPNTTTPDTTKALFAFITATVSVLPFAAAASVLLVPSIANADTITFGNVTDSFSLGDTGYEQQAEQMQIRIISIQDPEYR